MTRPFMLEPRAPELTDQERLARYRAGDLASFEALYDRYASSLLLYARSLTRNAAQSEDLVQDAFIRLMEYDPARLQGPAKGLLFATLRNLVTDEYRRAEVDRRVRPVLRLRAKDSVETGNSEELSQFLDDLPDEQRETILLKIFGGMTFDEIAEVTGTAAPTVMSRYRYALAKLGQSLKGK
jgi:RNA polymerase sigma-70 factor (ECF subfamily)